MRHGNSGSFLPNIKEWAGRDKEQKYGQIDDKKYFHDFASSREDWIFQGKIFALKQKNNETPSIRYVISQEEAWFSHLLVFLRMMFFQTRKQPFA